MKKQLDQSALEQLFYKAHTFNKFAPTKVDDGIIKELYELMKWGPTAVNCQPGRYVFIKSEKARARLLPALQWGNVVKVQSAPVTVIVAVDSKFYDHLPSQWTAYDARKTFADDQTVAQVAGFRNGTLQGAYLILAARSLGLDCGPMSGFDNNKVDAEFFPDGRFKSNFLINIGYGEENGYYPRGPRLSFEDAAVIL